MAVSVGVGEVVNFTGSVAGTWTMSRGRALRGSRGATFSWRAPATGGRATITLTTGSGTATKDMTVVAPNRLAMVRSSQHPLTPGTAGACMLCKVTVHPLDVNLGATQWLEVPGPGTSVIGYFKRFSAKTLYHNPNPKYLGFNDMNTGLRDHAAWHGVPAPYRAGMFQWVIPNRYKLDGEADSSGRYFTTTYQTFLMNPAGIMLILKAGAATSPPHLP